MRSHINIRGSGDGGTRRRARIRPGSWVLAIAVMAASVSAVAALGDADPKGGEPPPVPSIYSGFQSPDLPREWRWHRQPVRLEAPPPRLR